VILYIGGPVQSRERLIFGGVPATPRTLVVASGGNKQRMKVLCTEHAQSQLRAKGSLQYLFRSESALFAAYGEEFHRLLRSRQLDYVVAANINEMLPTDGGLLSWVHHLGVIAVETGATMIADIPPVALPNPFWWEASLGALGLREPELVSFWITTHANPVRYLRLESKALRSISGLWHAQKYTHDLDAAQAGQFP